MHNLELSYKYC